MDETSNADINLRISRLVRFYNGGVTYSELQSMPIPEFWEIEENAVKIGKEEEQHIQETTGRGI